MARIRVGGLRLVSTPLIDKAKEYEQDEYFCEWCDIVTKEETIYHKKKKLFQYLKVYLEMEIMRYQCLFLTS